MQSTLLLHQLQQARSDINALESISLSFLGVEKQQEMTRQVKRDQSRKLDSMPIRGVKVFHFRIRVAWI